MWNALKWAKIKKHKAPENWQFIILFPRHKVDLNISFVFQTSTSKNKSFALVPENKWHANLPIQHNLLYFTSFFSLSIPANNNKSTSVCIWKEKEKKNQSILNWNCDFSEQAKSTFFCCLCLKLMLYICNKMNIFVAEGVTEK